ncbi:hypothetical protein CM240_1275 [Clostridium bornimense]|uniref:BREX system P-loop protein BrxC n=1 Tax=Clostridium bornimense TaxID=1216932 RepID=W6RXW1_9CLOT|nr:BREX system P-loop protein BrxC [Clostridium bornimense]CDM68439.1 hypothetical protein CM240_1275 [Clostridium bornimense]
MKLSDMFVKDINREISGVIKVDEHDGERLYQELDEYVVTKEVAKHLSKFYDTYAKSIGGNTHKVGVWISGFFGSGKSHFLKMLSHLLENENVEGKDVIEFFKDKIEDPILYAEMERASKVKTECILFNVDSKNPINNKGREDAILRIFIKVFNEHRGLCAEIPGVAYMEKHLIKDGVYDDFKKAFKEVKGKEWLDRRRNFRIDKDYVAMAISKVLNVSIENAKDYVDNDIDKYETDIEKFALEINDYIKSKGDDFHLIFLADEVGQYIGDNSSLMLNLQTIEEQLSTKCNGKAWVMVTSQESIDEVAKVKGNDFSKITGRFDTRLSLSSIDVDEVIKKRILEKNDDSKLILKSLYDEKRVVLNNLISFENARKDLLGYRDSNEFIEVYPFIPYQFKILQNVFEQVRKHGNSGKHLSEGERSMLSAFKESVVKYEEQSEGFLIPMYTFYETIEEFLNPSITRVIDRASDDVELRDEPINLQILKLLFMIKYLSDEMPANLNNIATLMVNNIDEDMEELKEKIKASLRKLQSEHLIQKNGDVYTFLTDDEQEVNKAIESIEIDDIKISKWISDDIFQRIYDSSKYKMKGTNSLFGFTKKVDDYVASNKAHNIGLEVLTPVGDDYYKSDMELLSNSYKKIIIKFGGNDEYKDEIKKVLQIKSYKDKNNINALPENKQAILILKSGEIKIRSERAKNLIDRALIDASFYINGEKVEVKGNNAKDKISNAFSILIGNVFNKLNYIKKSISTEEEIVALVSNNVEQLGLDEIEGYNNQQAENEIFDFICLQEENFEQIRMKLLINRYMDIPYGWNLLDIAGVVAKLIKDEKINARLSGNDLSIEEPLKLVDSLTKLSEVDRVIINKKIRVDKSLLRKVKGVCSDVWGSLNLPDDEDSMAKKIREESLKLIDECRSYILKYQGKKYPGKSLFEKGIEIFNKVLEHKDNLSFFTELTEKGDELYDWSGDVELPKDFFNSNKIEMFDREVEILEKCEESIYYLDELTKEKFETLKEILHDPMPYDKIRSTLTIAKEIENELNDIVKNKISNAIEKVNKDYDYVKLRVNQNGVSDSTKLVVEKYYTELIKNISDYKDITKIDAAITRSNNKREEIDRVVDREIKAYHELIDIKPKDVEHKTNKQEVSKKKIEKVEIAKMISIKTLKTENDVEVYIRELKNKLDTLIREGKEIEID